MLPHALILRRSELQFIRYALVGFASNLALYVAYLLVTRVGIGHKSAMTALYALGVAQTFVFNRRWSFEYEGHARAAFLRYGLAYAGGYLLNLAALAVLVDWLTLPHQWVQGISAVVLAFALFSAQKFWVFRADGSSGSEASTHGLADADTGAAGIAHVQSKFTDKG